MDSFRKYSENRLGLHNNSDSNRAVPPRSQYSRSTKNYSYLRFYLDISNFDVLVVGLRFLAGTLSVVLLSQSLCVTLTHQIAASSPSSSRHSKPRFDVFSVGLCHPFLRSWFSARLDDRISNSRSRQLHLQFGVHSVVPSEV